MWYKIVLRGVAALVNAWAFQWAVSEAFDTRISFVSSLVFIIVGVNVADLGVNSSKET